MGTVRLLGSQIEVGDVVVTEHGEHRVRAFGFDENLRYAHVDHVAWNDGYTVADPDAEMVLTAADTYDVRRGPEQAARPALAEVPSSYPIRPGTAVEVVDEQHPTHGATGVVVDGDHYYWAPGIVGVRLEGRWRGSVMEYAPEQLLIMQEWTAVARTSEARRVADADADAAREAQALAIRAALEAGVSVAALVRASGLSRERIYQVRDGRR